MVRRIVPRRPRRPRMRQVCAILALRVLVLIFRPDR
jgi:hypothetical protein